MFVTVLSANRIAFDKAAIMRRAFQHAFRGAIAEDKAEGFLVGLDAACPVAVEG